MSGTFRHSNPLQQMVALLDLHFRPNIHSRSVPLRLSLVHQHGRYVLQCPTITASLPLAKKYALLSMPT
jgi:hypothetical protein